MNKMIITILLLLSISVTANAVDSSIVASQKACNKGNMSECTKLGILYLTADGVKENHPLARKLFIKACREFNLKGCHYMGLMYKRGANGVERNIKKAKKYFAHACKKGYEASCVQYRLIKEKPEVIGSGKNVVNSGYTYSPEIYGG